MFAIFLTEGMDPFYQNISSFPTVFFTLLLLVVAFYWLVAVMGFVDIEMLDIDIPEIDASAEGGSGSGGPDALAGLLLKLGLHGVPVTIIVTILTLIGWLISYYIVHFLFGIVPEGVLRYLAGIPVLVGSAYIAAIITAQVIKPLKPLFAKMEQDTVKKLLGQTALVRTSRVDDSFGEATLEDGGAGLILKVRATGSDTFAKGDRVVLLEHILESNVYRVVSEAEFLGE